MSHHVAVITGSLRKGSLSRAIAKNISLLAPPSLSFESVEIADLPLYNEDLETESPPESWLRFRRQVRACDAVLFATPEYNRSIPGVLKNAIDVGSRPGGKSVFAGKPAAVVGVSPGAMGAFGANHHLRQSLVFLDMPVLAQPEMYIGGAGALIDAEGNVRNESTVRLLRSFASAFEAWISRLAQTASQAAPSG